MDLEKLTRKELSHLIYSIMNESEIKDTIKSNLEHQRFTKIRCWECEDIATKLGINKEEN